MKKTTAMMALLLTIYAAVFFYGCTNKSSYSNSDDAYINYATDMQLMYHIGGNAPMTKSDKGYYYIGEDGIVIFIDKETKRLLLFVQNQIVLTMTLKLAMLI